MVEPVRALQISIHDPEIQAYLQRYPFIGGPDREMNARAYDAVNSSLSLRPIGRPCVPVMLKPEQTRLAKDELAVLFRMLADMKLTERRRSIHLNDFGWETNLVPRTAKEVLVIGCGDGVELVFLRAILPQARITAIDYHDSLLPGVKDTVGVDFLEGDMNLHLKSLTNSYDLIFSNHTMEHSYAPDELLATLISLMRPGGTFMAVLPMAGMEGTPFLSKLHRFSTASRLHPLDMIFVDAGHPWKTHPQDLRRTLEDAGLTSVILYQRTNHLSRPLAASPARFEIGKRVWITWNTIMFEAWRKLIKLVFPGQVPRKLLKLYFGIERRFVFGTNRLMNRYAQEALAMGRLEMVRSSDDSRRDSGI